MKERVFNLGGIDKMDKKLQEECYKLIKKYKSIKRESYKVKYRNKLYSHLNEYILIWTKSILNRWKRYMDKGELISNSWDIFIFCLDSYDVEKFDTHIPYFFARYTRYWLLTHYAKKEEGILVPLEDLEDTLKTIEDPQNIAFGRLLKLYRYRDTLPEDSKLVWDDALLSINYTDRKRDNYRSKKIGMADSTYLKLKQSFKGIIKFILEES